MLTGNTGIVKDRYMLIITGTGRSGTATLAKMLGGHHEFRVDYILDKYFHRIAPHSDPFDKIEKKIAVILDLHQGVDRETFIDSSNLYIHFIDALFALNPLAKFILAVRNGKDFVRSALSRKWHERISVGTVPNRDDPYFSMWHKMTPLQKNAWIWVHRNTKAIEGLKEVPESQKMVMRIEDIRSKEMLDKIAEFTGLKIDRTLAEKRINANPSFDLPPKEEWPDDMKSRFDEIAGEMMRYFGYQ